MLVGELALVVAALFSGAALYINLAEHPARLGLADVLLHLRRAPVHRALDVTVRGDDCRSALGRALV